MLIAAVCGLSVLAATLFVGFFPSDAGRGSFGQNLAGRPLASLFKVAWIASLLVMICGAVAVSPENGFGGTRLQLWHLGALGTALGSVLYFRYGDRL